MRADVRRQFDTSKTGAAGWAPQAVFVAGMIWVLWSVAALLTGGSEIVAFYAVSGWFVILAVVFLGLYGLKDGALFSVPVLLTIEALIDFFCIPGWRFANSDDQVDQGYVWAMFLTLIGFAAFWIAALLMKKNAGLRFAPLTPTTSNRVILVSAVFLALGLGAKFVLWSSGLLSYTAELNLQESSLPAMQWLTTLAQTLNAALLVSSIEVMGKRSRSPQIRFIFFASIIFSLGFGAISGMKGEILLPILTLILIYAVANAKFPRIAILFPLMPLIVFPFVTAYRNNLNSGYRSQVNTVSGLAAVLEKTVTDVVGSNLSLGDRASSSFDATTNRLSILTDVRDVISLPDPSLLNGDEEVWMAPIYPFVPRFVWKNKPILDKGRRLSVALGRPDTTSSASTPIGDLYSLYGTWGVPIGMCIFGICVQIYMNSLKGAVSEKRLLIYFVMLRGLLDFENGIVAQIAGTVQLALIAILLAYVIYGKSPVAVQAARTPGLSGPR